jgi:methionyl-tRNA formyltransferase
VAPDGRLGTVDGSLVLLEVQPEGKRTMPATEWLRGVHGEARVDAP